jgi:hypothetical protein
MLFTFAELPCEQDTLKLQIVIIRCLSGTMQTLLSINSAFISKWSSDNCVELNKVKHPLGTYANETYSMLQSFLKK